MIPFHKAEKCAESAAKFCCIPCHHPNVISGLLLIVLKVSSLFVLIFLFFFNTSHAEIKNGYATDILILRQSLKNLTEILVSSKDLSGFKKRKIQLQVEILIDQITFYDLTENLLNQFKIISPSLYAEIDTISDRQGRTVDVYVKFVPAGSTKIEAWGSTYINQVGNDQDAYLSEYGPFTVSVKIWIVPKALLVLSHELGHVKYQVPNLASYMTFHKKSYCNTESNYLGHHSDDPSGKMAHEVEKIFRKDFNYFLERTDEKIQNPVVLLTRIRKSMSPKQYAAVKTWPRTLAL